MMKNCCAKLLRVMKGNARMYVYLKKQDDTKKEKRAPVRFPLRFCCFNPKA